jgi:3-phosphoshikimate 1-carboxyvinyltransferase
MSELRVVPSAQPLRGTIRAPADKSISHRAVILSALADSGTRIDDWLESETTRATLNCMRQLGVDAEEPSPGVLVVHGRGLHSLSEPSEVLFCAGSGTTMRLLSGVCAGQDALSILDGTPALKRRPMARVVEPLRSMGASILARDGGRLPPLVIHGGNLRGIEYGMPIASAQVKSAILLAGLFADSPTTVREAFLSRDHTERMLSAFGARLDRKSDTEVSVHPISHLQSPGSISIPSDLSSAAFFVVAALLIPNSEICIEHVGINPTRIGLLDALGRMGASVKIENAQEESGEPTADLVVRGGKELRATAISCEDVPRMIDEFPIFAVVATQARGETIVRGAQELRVKESDRIGALEELRKMGARVEELEDGFVVEGPTKLNGARVSAHGDHRLAMSLAVAGLIARGETVIEGWECVADSFPHFERLLPP